MAKYGTGELVRFKASELLVSAGAGGTVKIGTDKLVGKITGSVETTGEETKYYVEVKLPDGTFAGVSDVVLKLTALESQIQSEKEHLDVKFDEFVKRVIPTFNPDPDSWIRSFLECGCGPCEKKSIDVAAEFADVLKKWENTRPLRYYIGIDLAKRPLGPNEKDMIRSHIDFQPSEKTLSKIREFARMDNVHRTDRLVPADGEGKMSKDRCVKLLQSYRAEREKVKKGRKFERCLRDSVVDEALERAIELLSEKS
jgi:hypothetical protein